MGTSEYMKINVRIDNKMWPMKIRREEEYLYREAAKMLSDKIIIYRENYQEMGSIDHWTMVAFEMAFQVMKNREDERNNGFRSRIEQLDKELDKYMNNREIKNG